MRSKYAIDLEAALARWQRVHAGLVGRDGMRPVPLAEVEQAYCELVYLLHHRRTLPTATTLRLDRRTLQRKLRASLTRR